MRIARLCAADAPSYRTLMLEAYALAADAFTATADERSREPLPWWERRIASPDGLSEAFGAFDGAALFGAVALEYSARPKIRHSALVIGMYVRADQRGCGAGTALLRAAIAAARSRPQVQVLRLTVTQGNAPALRLYESMGFVPWGTEPQAILSAEGFKSKVHMSMGLPLTEPGP